MEIRERLTTAEILHLAHSSDYSPNIPNEIFTFFDEHFDFSTWKWDDQHLFWQYLDDFYPLSISYQDAVVYIDDINRKQRLIESISWLLKTLQNEQSDEKNQKIAFELTCLIPNFWEISYEENIIFSHSSKKLAMQYLSHLNTELSTHAGASINDKEIIGSLIENLKNKIWKELAENQLQLNLLYEQLRLNFHQAYSFISEHHSHEILSLINQENKVCNLLYWLALLPEKYYQPFTLKTTNNLAKFLLLFKLGYLSRNDMKEKQIQLSDIWQNCPNEWFYIFNQYAVSYPYFQLGFGAFLTNASNKKIRIYIDSLHLNENEDSIKECLEYFFTYADKNRIEYLCRLAYEKWKDWDFDNSYSVKRSILDRALVKYFQIIMSKQEREQFIHNEITQILSFQQLWFTSITELNKFVYLHLSRMQPACIASTLQEDPSESFEDIQYPEQFESDLRWKNWLHLN